MNIDAGIILGNRNQVAFIEGKALYMSLQDDGQRMYFGGNRKLLVEDISRVRYLASCPYGIHLAFWSDNRESFRLVDIFGTELWSCWMNSDKCVPQSIHFSISGDALACGYHFDGMPGLFFCDYLTPFTTLFGCCRSPIGFDTSLQYFALDYCNPNEDQKLAFFERDVPTGKKVLVPPEVISQKLKQSPLLVDRNRCLISTPVIPVPYWQALAIQRGLSGLVLLKDDRLSWYSDLSGVADYTIPDCLPKRGASWYCPTLSIEDATALIQSDDRAIVALRGAGIIWQGENISSVILRGQRILVQYKSGTVAVILSTGKEEVNVPPSQGFQVLASDINSDILTIASIAEMSQNIIFKSFPLGDGNSSGQGLS